MRVLSYDHVRALAEIEARVGDRPFQFREIMDAIPCPTKLRVLADLNLIKRVAKPDSDGRSTWKIAPNGRDILGHSRTQPNQTPLRFTDQAILDIYQACNRQQFVTADFPGLFSGRFQASTLKRAGYIEAVGHGPHPRQKIWRITDKGAAHAARLQREVREAVQQEVGA